MGTTTKKERTSRFEFIDQYRGLVGVMMLLGHSNYYWNSLWHHFDPLDPVFPSLAQFGLRYMGYLCAPGFLMMNGAMVWYSYTRRRAAGKSDVSAKWHLIQRGLFLVLVQVTWVNSSWGGFASFKPGHLGIIACIGLAMIGVSFIVHLNWKYRLAIALVAMGIHPLLLTIPYDSESLWQLVTMQTFVDSGSWNKYPLIPWFSLALLGSVMATGWLEVWKTPKERIVKSLAIMFAALALATLVRVGRDYGNIFPFSYLGHYSFFLDQKYPPSLYHGLWFFGAVVGGVGVIHWLGQIWPKLTAPLGIVGRVPLFYYCVHIGILGIFVKRIGIYYREGEVLASLIGWVVMMIIMLPLARWFGGVKRRSKNFFVRLI